MNRTAMTFKEWKAGVKTSSHIREGEVLRLRRRDGDSICRALVEHTPIDLFIGAYDSADGKGWWHE